MKNKKLWPFSFTPAGLGLQGKDRERAEAYYYYSGEDLERKLNDINHEPGAAEHVKTSREIDVKYNKLSSEEMKYAKLLEHHNSDTSSNEYKLGKLDLDFEYRKISQIEYDKQKATLLNEPWVGYRDYKLEKDAHGKTGLWFEFDWNELFVEQLKTEGYVGKTDEEIIRKWYGELCRAVALEEGMALDLFDDEEEASKKIKRDKIDEDRSKYS
jgi:hypothetical protein